ncbi:MAG: hypothetical protein IJU91_05815 [Selenomonadaceae bacterium]|nr:hypothetical protein [Selenomonadaceae bacterium]
MREVKIRIRAAVYNDFVAENVAYSAAEIVRKIYKAANCAAGNVADKSFLFFKFTYVSSENIVRTF